MDRLIVIDKGLTASRRFIALLAVSSVVLVCQGKPQDSQVGRPAVVVHRVLNLLFFSLSKPQLGRLVVDRGRHIRRTHGVLCYATGEYPRGS